MSRSRKKLSIFNDNGNSKYCKKQSNKKVRQYKRQLSDGNMYRKIYDSRNIHDWRIVLDKRDGWYERGFRK